MLDYKPKLIQKTANTPNPPKPYVETYLRNFISKYRESLSLPPVQVVTSKPLPRLIIPKDHIEKLVKTYNDLVRNTEIIIEDYYKNSDLKENRIKIMKPYAISLIESELFDILFKFYKTAFQQAGIDLNDHIIFGYVGAVLKEIKPRDVAFFPLGQYIPFRDLLLRAHYQHVEPRKVPEDFIIRKLPTGTASEPLFEVLNPQQILIDLQGELKNSYISTLGFALRRINNIKERDQYVRAQMMRRIMEIYKSEFLGSSPDIKDIYDVYVYAKIAYRNIFGLGFEGPYNPYFARYLKENNIDIKKLLKAGYDLPVGTPIKYPIAKIYPSPVEEQASIDTSVYTDKPYTTRLGNQYTDINKKTVHTDTLYTTKLKATSPYFDDPSAMVAGFGLGGLIPFLLGGLQSDYNEKKTRNLINTIISLYQLSQTMPKNQHYIPTTSISSTPFILYDRWQ
ncbi:MAG: hypothetical protein QXH92_04040 [Candidatus Aenigmatarchaeota archaeon]